MKIIIFGTGQFYKLRKQCFAEEDIIAYMDNNEKLHGKKLDGYLIYDPNFVTELSYDAICIMTGKNYEMQIKEQLKTLGVLEDRIYSFQEYFAKSKIKKIVYYGHNTSGSIQIAYFLPNLANTGGIRAALYALKILKKHYKNIVAISTCDGDVRCELQEMGIDILLTPDLSENNIRLWELMRNVNTVFINGLYFSYLMPYIKTLGKQIIWWLHTGQSLYDVYPLPSEDFLMDGIKVLGVSELVKEAFLRHSSHTNMEILPFGIPDQWDHQIRPINEKMIFVIVGAITWIKGIDLMVHAVKNLQNKSQNQFEVWVIGAEANAKYAEEVHHISEDILQIKWLGARGHDEVIRLLNQSDVLISASREDMLPIVVSEALMCGKACIVSSAIGSASFMTHKQDGMIFQSESIEELSNCMGWCLEHQDALMKIGENGRHLFEAEFSMDIFEKRLMSIVK